MCQLKVLYVHSDFPGVGQAASLPGGFSDDEGVLGGGGACGGAAGAGLPGAGRRSPAFTSYRLCQHEGQGYHSHSLSTLSLHSLSPLSLSTHSLHSLSPLTSITLVNVESHTMHS